MPTFEAAMNSCVSQNAFASPPYLTGSSDLSTKGKSSFPIVAGPVPTTLIFASVCADTSGLNNL